MKEEIKKLLEDCECTGSRCPHEISGKHYVMIPEDVDALIDLAVSKERERVTDILEKEKATWANQSIGYKAVESIQMAFKERLTNLINTK